MNLEFLGRALHAVHGTRGLLIAAILLLFMSLIEPAVGTARGWIAGPLLLLFLMGYLTLPREGVAAQRRAERLVHDPEARAKLLRRLPWIVLLVVFLLPNFFLAAYGIPHLSPLSGVLLDNISRRISLVFQLLIILLPILHLRGNKILAKDVLTVRPKELSDGSRHHQTRDLLLVTLIMFTIAWAFLLRSFWSPFSLLAWPPDVSSLQYGVGPVVRLVFTFTLPAVLYMTLATNFQLLAELRRFHLTGTRRDVVLLALVHAGLTLTAVILHAYNLVWIVRYEGAAQF